jgi:hypothetical protein
MSQRGADFMTEWLRENINADAYPAPDDEQIEEYAERCLAAASAEGISQEEIEEDMGAIEDCIADAMESAADAKVQRLAEDD